MSLKEENHKDIKDRVLRWVDSKFGGDWDGAFTHYAGKNNSDFTVNKDELRLLLNDAGFVSWIEQTELCDKIMKQKAKDSTNSSDDRFEKREFFKMFRS
jgi:hypothetical protein